LTPAGYHHVELVMGTAVSIDVRDEDAVGAPGLDEVLQWLQHVDRTFSTYRDDSPISQLGRHEIDVADGDEDVRAVLARCDRLRHETGGAFDVHAVPAPNGTTLDPSGYVKGWAIERAAQLLEEHGLANFCINAGGDIVVRGHAEMSRAWRVGVRDPRDPEGIAFVLEVAGPTAVATSSTYERGAHIIDPRTGKHPQALSSVTVLGPDLGEADAYATAIFVMGVQGIHWLAGVANYEAVVTMPSGATRATQGFAAHLQK
jgi:thiamine biosynthesis lipoprotein